MPTNRKKGREYTEGRNKIKQTKERGNGKNQEH